MDREHLFAGRTKEEAVERGLRELGLSRDQVVVTVVSEGKKTLFRKGKEPWVVRIRLKEPLDTNKLWAQAEEIARNVDGTYRIEYREDGVYLVLTPPAGHGAPVSRLAVENEIKRRLIQNADLSSLQDWIENPSPQEHRIAPPQEEHSADGRLELIRQENDMLVKARIIPPIGKGKPLTLEQAREILQQANIVYGIKEDNLRLFVEEQNTQEFVLAVGDEPVPGEDGQLRFYFTVEKKKPTPQELTDGRVDYYNLFTVESVRQGDVLVRRSPPTEGIPGMKVTGEKIPARPGIEVNLPVGENVQFSPDGNALLAACDGRVFYQNGKVSVKPVYEINGDVDLSVGNIQFIGTVIVRGNVQSGISIEAGGDLEIFGSVEAATLIAGRNIILHRGFQGRNKGRIQGEGNLSARFLENAKVEIKGDIVVGEAIMHCQVSAGKSIVVGGKGLLVGGLIQAGEEVRARVIGSSFCTATEIEVGVNPALRANLAKTEQEQNSVNNSICQVECFLEILKRLERNGQLTPDKKELQAKLTLTLPHLLERAENLNRERHRLEEELAAANRGKVVALDHICCGVKVTIGKASKYFRDEIKSCSLYLDRADVAIGPAV